LDSPESDIPSNEQLMIDTAQAHQPNVQAEDESKRAMTEFNNQENVINHSTNLMKDTSSWSFATRFMTSNMQKLSTNKFKLCLLLRLRINIHQVLLRQKTIECMQLPLRLGFTLEIMS
jgi:hypothetical protein